MLGAPSNALKVGSRSIQSPANDNDRFLSYAETECDGARSRPRYSVPPTLRRFRELRQFRGGLSSFLVCSGAFPHLGTCYRLVSRAPTPEPTVAIGIRRLPMNAGTTFGAMRWRCGLCSPRARPPPGDSSNSGAATADATARARV